MEKPGEGSKDELAAQRQARLEASEQRYRLLFERASDAIFVSDAEGRIVEVNTRACELAGYPASALRGMRVEELFADAARQRRSGAWPALDVGALARVEREVRRADGAVLVAEVHLRRIDAGTVEAIVRDVTERRQMEDVLHRYAERLVSLHRLDQVTLSVQSSNAVAEAAIANLRQFIPCEQISVLVFDEASGEAELLSASSAEVDMPPGFDLNGSGAIAEALRRREINVVRDLHGMADEPVAAALAAAGFGSMLNVPLVSQAEVIGVLSLVARPRDAFSVEHVDVARETAVLLSLAVQNTRLFEAVQAARARQEQLSRRLVQVQEEERRRLALELHDEIGQVLTALRLSFDTDDPAMPAPVRSKLERAKKIVEVLTTKVRNLSLDLRPTLLDDLGLLPALLWYIRRYTEQTGVEVHFRHAGLGSRRFSVEVETAAYRIVQEALTNVARHAGVREAEVQAWIQDERLHLQVEDHGRGFSPREEQSASSGLSGMRERAHLAGGELTVTAPPGEGVQIQASLPLAGRPPG